MSRQRKIVLGVLGLCGCALVTDRVFFAPGEAAAAAPDAAAEFAVDQGSAPHAEASADELRELEARRSVVTVAQRLANFSALQPLDGTTTSNPFLPAWINPAGHRSTNVSASPVMTHDPVRFAREHRLTAVMGAGAGQYAVVNGQLLRRGDAIGPFMLVEISERSARFEGSDGRMIELNLNRDEPISASSTPHGSQGG